MRTHVLLVALLTVVLPGVCRAQKNAPQELPKDPQAILADAAPFYNFSDASLKPFHLKATYQLYDENGKPGGQGTYEYWWVSPKVHRSTWMRLGATLTDWYTADGRHVYEASGSPLTYFEYKLQSVLLSPLPDDADADPAKKVRLERKIVSFGREKLPCVLLIGPKLAKEHLQARPLVDVPTYCFDPQRPVLRVSESGDVLIFFNRIAEVEDRYLACEVQVSAEQRKILTATVDEITPLLPANPALTPARGALPAASEMVTASPSVEVGGLIKKVHPAYPPIARQEGIAGTVILQVVIGTDGKVRNVQVISTPSPELAESASDAVSKWEYKPYLVNGTPVGVEIIVHVIYSLGPPP
ncbi:MAG: energy transducer TonB [Terracidiphilus sp.]